MQTPRKASDSTNASHSCKPRRGRRWLGVGVGVSSLLVGILALPTHAMCDSELWRSLHDEVAAGHVISLSQLLDGLERDWIGQVVEVELDDSKGNLNYEVEMLGPQGQMARFIVRASDGSLREVRGVNLESMRRHADSSLPQEDGEIVIDSDE